MHDDRVVIALGGNAMLGEHGEADAPAQQRAVERAMEQVAELVADGWHVVLTHGNGPQVGNLLVKNEMARDVVPAMPLDWCVAQTQATVGFMVANALEQSLARRRLSWPVVAVVSRVEVAAGDPAFQRPTKPIGRYLPEAEARLRSAEGQSWRDFGVKGWRRVVPSPEPIAIVDRDSVVRLVDAGFIVVAAGGGGIPVVRHEDGLRGVEAVIDKDLTAMLLARTIGASQLQIATDVEHVLIHYGTPSQRPLGRVSSADLRGLADQRHFQAGSMGPKVEAAIRFVEQGGRAAVITSLDRLARGVRLETGTIVTA
ncbi:MAG: carbamate kinase [Candidatus Dormibacteraeota bacterium]|nr:carbamate kinase [Candidatus Dormibacteraeota bacterium]